MKPLRVEGPGDDGRYQLVLAELPSLDGDLDAIIDFVRRSLGVTKNLDSRWELLTAVKTRGTSTGGLEFYVEAVLKWKPADNSGKERLS